MGMLAQTFIVVDTVRRDDETPEPEYYNEGDGGY